MKKYFVRYTYPSTEYSQELHDFERIETSDIISTEHEFEDISDVREKLRSVFSWRNIQEHEFDVIALNVL
ncbi:hypothetical protein FDH34_gp461 [Serratia phage BF]|uniref:Phage protein n=3 Tax=Eneladusvirus BF TaxID=2560751 RepID=A0A7L8ZPI6_9CAUD|nr:hypothetical protein FDH34_gp461 [Serratia phage BF]QOI71397.1 hypothetical protein pEaSNUABM12_00479 [Erwinia phage pEa_SNUABM_12]QOI71939.1 hypothetical protein pEaSNUABM47_00475 [Erwinia phage pEa_SNUABM_47]QXO11606.1 hypothetical protein pEaSNUABM19_00480 [Erwinia phage pEa_SNUABM_19]QXO12708.1 hypothetical protein pEaSNUABM49_00482 [Erwinia phage pEa_SNUABM_49]AQW88984.1 hypothetical protein BF_0459 [Serratia phage BF]